MANKATKANVAQTRKEKKHFHGRACVTSFWIMQDGRQVKNPATNRKSPWKGASTTNKRATRAYEAAA